MKALSLKLDDGLFFETEKILSNLKMPRNTYIQEALAAYNRIKRREYLEKQYAYEATLIAESSMEVLREMENLDPHLLGEYKTEHNYEKI
jgi:hypothetical protein